MGKEDNLIKFTSENQPPAEAKSRKGIPNRATVFKNLLSIKIDANDIEALKISPALAEQMKKGKLTLYEVAAIGQIQAAIEGNTKAFQEIQDSIHGKIPNKAEITGAEGEPLIPKEIGQAILEIYGSGETGGK